MADLSHAPFTLPPGGFEHSDLEKAGAAIAKAKPEDRDKAIGDELGKVVKREDQESVPGALPGHKMVDRDRVIVEGTQEKGQKEPVGQVTVTETIQVFDPKKADEEIAAAEEATAGLGTVEAASAATSKS